VSAPKATVSSERGRRAVGSTGGVRRPEDDDVASVLERLAALVGAGVSPVRAWGHVADALTSGAGPVAGSSDSSPRGRSTADVVRAVADSVSLGTPVPDALRAASTGRAWRVTGAAWSVAAEAGAPMAPFLSVLAATLGTAARLQREIEAGLAGPVATTRLVTALPVVAALGGALSGLGTLAALASPPGLVCVVSAVLLLVAASRWSRALVRRARRDDVEAGLALDLIAIGLAGGGSTTRARRLAREACEEFRLEFADASALALLELARVSGAPPAELLRSEARRIRADAAAAAARRAAALGTWLMLPLGLCTLPAFLLLAVVPVLLALLASTT
jgi:tight adherence protein B